MPEDEIHKTDPDAMAIYQTHIDRATAAVLAFDFDAFVACISFPWNIKTTNLELRYETAEDHREDFDFFSDTLHSSQVTDLHRIVQSAWFVSADVIEGTHVSHVMRNGKRIQDPYYNRIRLIRSPIHGWRESDCSNGILNKAGNFGIVQNHSVETPPPALHEIPKGNTND